MVMVDDSHAVGLRRPGGRGTPELLRRDGPRRHRHRHARQGARRRQRRLHQRPPGDRRLAAPALAAVPVQQLAGARDRGHHAAACWRCCSRADELQRQLERNATQVPRRAWRRPASPSPAPATRSSRSCSATRGSPARWPSDCWPKGIYVIAFSFPVVPQGKARIRTQMSAAHSDEDIDRAIAAFTEVGRRDGACCDEGAGEGQGRARPAGCRTCRCPRPVTATC